MTNKIYLLDANVLIALATPDHTLHTRARAWFQAETYFATCPITQGALLRFHLRQAAYPSIAAAKDLLSRISALPRHEFWPDDASYLKLPEKGVLGHRQVTDAYLVTLAAKHKGALATMDEALAAVHPTAVLV
jgi:uncharacterized protein